MSDRIKVTQGKEYDCLIIGGGINGASIAHLAQDHGLQVCLIEKDDFASGTSSKSTKLVHGGIRYLENFDFGLVKEALHERAIQLEVAPHLVKPIPFLIPVYKGDKRPLWVMQLGVWLYDLLAGKYKIKKHQKVNVAEIKKLIPGVKEEGLVGGVIYWDAQMDDSRLCLENVLQAKEKGADVFNYLQVQSFIKKEGKKVVGVKVKDNITNEEGIEIYSKKIICTAGPWANLMLKEDDPNAKKKIRTTKGVHLVYEGQISDHAMLLPSDRDGRIFFVIPWRGNSLIGTTDTNYVRRPELAKVLDKDVDYLLENTQRIFTNQNFSKDKIITSFAGLRPLARKWGSPSKVSRKHVISKTKSGIIFVTGGKYTTYRKIAEDCLKKGLGVRVKNPFSLYGSSLKKDDFETDAKRYQLDLKVIESIASLYGSRYKDVLDYVAKNSELGEVICENPIVIKAQIPYSKEKEFALKSEDILSRRLSLSYYPNSYTQNCKEQLSSFF